MSSPDTAALTRRFLVLRATRWLPTGLLIPVLVLLLVDRGLSLAQIGLAAAAQGLVVFCLELPTGGLADAVGRRPVLIVASMVEIVSLALLLMVDSTVLLAAVFALQGVYRALESGPLDAWYVDELRSIDADADIVRGMARGGAVLGLAIAAGALMSAGLVAAAPVDGVNALALPVVLAIVLRGADLLAITTLMREPATGRRRGSLRESIREVPSHITATTALVRASGVLAALIAVEFLWGFGMVSFETLTPPKLAEVTGSTESAAALFGPAVAIAWIASAVGATLVPRLSTRFGAPRAAMALHIVQALMVVGLAVSSGPVGVVVFYLLTLGTHGAINPAYQALLHEQADDAHRTTVVSAASMMAHPGGALGAVLLGLLADRTSVTIAMLVGAVALAATVPLYLPARRAERMEPDIAAAPVG